MLTVGQLYTRHHNQEQQSLQKENTVCTFPVVVKQSQSQPLLTQENHKYSQTDNQTVLKNEKPHTNNHFAVIEK